VQQAQSCLLHISFLLSDTEGTNLKHKYIKNVVTLTLDKDKCIGCAMCEKVCPHSVFKIHGGKAVIADIDSCMECGACVRNCPVKALDVKKGVG